jgi:hypothetical protein
MSWNFADSVRSSYIFLASLRRGRLLSALFSVTPDTKPEQKNTEKQVLVTSIMLDSQINIRS